MQVMTGPSADDQAESFEPDVPEEGTSADAGDARLVHDARRGDLDAFGLLVKRYERRVLKVVRRFITDHHIASDLTQDTFLKAYERLEQFDPSRRFGPWLFRIAVNRTYDHLRKIQRRGRWAVFSDAGDEHRPDPAVGDPRPDLELSAEVHVVLQDVPEAYRTVIVLRDLEGFSTSEIAAITERSEATIRWRLAEARRMFREAWERRERKIEETRLS